MSPCPVLHIDRYIFRLTSMLIPCNMMQTVACFSGYLSHIFMNNVNLQLVFNDLSCFLNMFRETGCIKHTTVDR